MMIFSQIFHLSGEEILIEKFEALNFRNKGRDIFDIWFLLSRGIRTERLKGKMMKSLQLFPQAILAKDLGKFLPIGQKQIIPSLKNETIKLLEVSRTSSPD